VHHSQARFLSVDKFATPKSPTILYREPLAAIKKQKTQMTQTFQDTGLDKCKTAWIVAYTKSRAEREVDSRLREKGITSFLPLKKTFKQWSDRKKWVEEPLFSSYVFVNVGKTDYYKAVSTTGIVRFLTNSGRPVQISDKEIEIIKKATSDYKSVELSGQKYSIGDKVLITQGSLRGTTGILVEFRGKYRVAIRIDSLGFSLLVDISINNLRLI
jgi:transcriptional antiterminator RfaH